MNQRPPGYEPDELPGCSIPRRFFGAGDRNRTGTILQRPQDFKSCASASSATPAFLAPRVGLEPTTYRLTAGCSTIELPRNIPFGNDLLSQAVSHQVPSALRGLTSVFGMGTGVSLSLLLPNFSFLFFNKKYYTFFSFSCQLLFSLHSKLYFWSSPRLISAF